MTSSQPRIVFIIYQSENQSNGGVESISQVITRLVDWERHVITNRDTDRTRRWQQAGLATTILSFHRRYRVLSKWINLLVTNYRTYRYVKSYRIRLVHCNDIQSMLHSGLGAKLAGSRLVFNIRDVKAGDQSYGAKWQYARWLADYILVLSREMQQSIQRRLPVRDSSTIGYQHSMVNFDRFYPRDEAQRADLRKQLDVPSDAPVIGMVAAIMPKKQQLSFITHTLPNLIEELPSLLVYFIGDFDVARNPYARRCQETCQSLGLDQHVRFLGYQPSVEQWYSVFDLTVVASEREGLARCMIESIASGTPVVSFDVCSAHEILSDHQCGRVVRQGDHAALAQNIAALLRDEDGRKQLACHGVAASRTLFDAGAIHQAYARTYQNLLSA